MSYNSVELEDFTRQFVRQAQSSDMYSRAQVHRAWQLAADEWMRLTHATKTAGTVTLTANSAVMPVAPTGWKPEYAIEQYVIRAGVLVNPDFTFLDYPNVLRKQYEYQNQTGTPQYFAYPDLTNAGICTPTPNYAFTVYFWYWQPFTSWVAGLNCASFNLPDEHLRIIATDGAEAFMQPNEKANSDLAAAALMRFRERARQIKGRMAGGRGGNEMERDDPDAQCGPYIIVA
jgi:hypothetical protein